jgi:Fumarylacetoacetase N-terminal domain 2
MSHYAPVLIASLSIRIRRADVQKIWMTSVENGPTLQSALDDWDRISPKLADLAEALEEGTAPHISFDPAQCAGDTSIGPRELGRAGERAAKRRCMVRIPCSVLLLHSDISTFKRK